MGWWGGDSAVLLPIYSYTLSRAYWRRPLDPPMGGFFLNDINTLAYIV